MIECPLGGLPTSSMNPYMPSKRGRSVDRLETEHPAQRIRRHTLRRRHSATSASGPEASNESDPTQPTAIEPDTDRSALNNTPSTSRTPNVENEVIFSLDFGTRYTTGKFAWVQNVCPKEFTLSNAKH